jgi:hypothetical protein
MPSLCVERMSHELACTSKPESGEYIFIFI